MDHTASLVIRTLVGFPFAYVGGFIGMIAGSLFIPSINQNDFLPLFIRVVLIGIGTTAGASVTWLTFLLEWPKRTVLIAASFVGGTGAGLIAFYSSEALTGNSDLYILVREITQSTIIGAAIGANALAVVIGAFAPRQWRS